jgi:hypothetical protein
MRRGRDFTAGLLLSLCATKVHLFALVPLVLLIHRRWRVLGGGALGGGVLVAVSFLSDGWDWPSRYLALLSNPVLHPGPDHMPTLRGLIFAATGGESKILLLLLSSLVVLVLLSIAWESSMEVGLAFALVGGLLIGYHAYLPDCMILLMTFVLVLEHSRFVPLRGAVALTITPPVLFCLMLGSPWNAVVPISLLITMALAAIHCRTKKAFLQQLSTHLHKEQEECQGRGPQVSQRPLCEENRKVAYGGTTRLCRFCNAIRIRG